MYALNLADDGRILSATFEKYAPEGATFTENLPEGNISDYRYIDGAFIHDPLPEPEEPTPPEAPTLEQRVETLELDYEDTKEALEMILSGVVE